jgi:hypothetical protein
MSTNTGQHNPWRWRDVPLIRRVMLARQRAETRQLNRDMRVMYAVQANAELREAYNAQPVELRILVATRLYLVNEFPQLDHHLQTSFGEDDFFIGTGRRGVDDFFRRARVAAGQRGYWTRVIDLQRRDDPPYLGPQRWRRLHPLVDSATVYLGMPRPGIASLTVSFALRDDAFPIRDLFLADHPVLVRKFAGQEIGLTVADSKSSALGDLFRAIIDSGVFPPGTGLPRILYPGGLVAVYSMDERPRLEGRNWRDVERVLGIDDFLDKWESTTEILAGGLPHANDEFTGGASIVVPTAGYDLEEVRQAYQTLANRLSSKYLEYMIALTPWIAARTAVDDLTNEAAVLRQRLQLYRGVRVRRLFRGRLMPMLTELSRCRHMVHLLGAFEHVGPRFPDLVFVPPFPAPPRPPAEAPAREPVGKRRFLDRLRKRSIPSTASSEPEPTPRRTFRSSMERGIGSSLKVALEDLDASLQRGSQLLQVRTAISVRTWAFVTLLVTLALLAVTILSVAHAR